MDRTVAAAAARSRGLRSTIENDRSRRGASPCGRKRVAKGLLMMSIVRILVAVARNRPQVRVLLAYAVFAATQNAVWIGMLVYAYGRGGAARRARWRSPSWSRQLWLHRSSPRWQIGARPRGSSPAAISSRLSVCWRRRRRSRRV